MFIIYMVSWQWIAILPAHLVKWIWVSLAVKHKTSPGWRPSPFFLAKQPDHDRDQYRLFGILLLEWSWCARCSMEITFPNPSTARHDRNPKLGINYGLSRANMINPWSRSILTPIYIGPRSTNKYQRTFGDRGSRLMKVYISWKRRMMIMTMMTRNEDDDDIPEKVFARSLLYLIFATDKEVMNLKWRFGRRINFFFFLG